MLSSANQTVQSENFLLTLMKFQNMVIGEKAKVNPILSGLSDWVEGVIIKIFKNPFLGDEIAVKDDKGYIYYGEKKYFKAAQ